MNQYREFQSKSPANSPNPTSTRGIQIHGWSISSTRGTIASSSQLDSISNHLNIPMPEMPFPNNHLTIKHHKSGFSYTLDGNRALASVEGVKQENRLMGLDLRDSLAGHQKAVPTSRDSKAKAAKQLGQKPKSKGIKVAYADQWGKSRDAFGTAVSTSTKPSSSNSNPTDIHHPEQSNATPPQSTNPDPSTFPASASSHFGPQVALAAAQSGIDSSRNYDWTYSNTWPGLEGVERSLDVDEADNQGASVSNAESNDEQKFIKGDFKKDRIPTERLVPGPNAEPILFYDDLILFEDELADNGSSVLRVKVRVMPSCFLILQRFFLRVDEVLFRIFDTRIWVDFLPPGKAAAPVQSSVPRPFNPIGTSSPSWHRAPESSPRSDPRNPSSRNQKPGPSAPVDSLSQDVARINLGPTRKETSRHSALDSPMHNQQSRNPNSQGSEMTADQEKDGFSEEIKIIRECSGYQASYSEVKSHLPPWKAKDLSPLTEENWVLETLKKITNEKLKKKFLQSNHNGNNNNDDDLRSSSDVSSSTRDSRPISNPISNLDSSMSTKDSSYNRFLEEISPARIPLENEGGFVQSNRILGQVEESGSKDEKHHAQESKDQEDEEELDWEGCGERVDIVILKP